MNYDRRLDDKEFRRAQTRRYLDAGTCAGEERDLAAYYASNAPDEDEKAVAALLEISARSDGAVFESLVSEEAAREFDRLAGVGRSGSGQRRRIGIWSGALLSCALATALVLILRPASGQYEIPPDDTPAGADEIPAVPLGDATLLTLKLEDETSIEYILTHGSEEGSASLTLLGER